MWASVRNYQMSQPWDDVLEKHLNEGFVPIISGAPGFVAYHCVRPSDDVLVSVSVFQDEAGAVASNDLAKEFVEENLASYLGNPPTISAGEVTSHKLA